MIFNKKVLTISLIVILAGVLVYFFFLRKKVDSSEGESMLDSSESTKKPEEIAIPVKVTTARRGELIIKLRSPGEAVTNRKIVRKAEVSGVIKAIKIDESQHVRKGDLLLELDDREYQLSLKSSEADRLKNLSDLLLEKQFAEPMESSAKPENREIPKAREKYEKARQLYRQGMISEEEFEQAYRQFELVLIESGEKKEEIMAAAKGLTQSEIRVKKDQMNLEKTKIRAPFSGIITDIKVSLYEHVTGASELFTLVNISRIQVHAKVLESEIGKIQVGRDADLMFSAYPEKIFKGKVKAISPIINPEDKTCNVIVDVANPEEKIKPGMHAEVEIVTEIHKNKLIIPQEAILVREGRKVAFVIENDLAKWKYIEIGIEDEDYAEVLAGAREGEGVKEGDIVIIEGHFTLAHDAKVRVVKQ